MNDVALEKERIYALSSLQKVKYIEDLHSNLKDVRERVMVLLDQLNDVSIISIAPVSGVGKTALVKELVSQSKVRKAV